MVSIEEADRNYMANVIDVAECILSKLGTTSTWKLQKLVYYSQAWHCVWHDRPLFTSKIEAWANGPVCKKLYDAHKGKYSVKTVGGDIANLKMDEKETIGKVVKFYGKFNGQQLSDITHSEEPWKIARNGLGPSDRGENVITLENMSEYYSSLQ